MTAASSGAESYRSHRRSSVSETRLTARRISSELAPISETHSSYEEDRVVDADVQKRDVVADVTSGIEAAIERPG